MAHRYKHRIERFTKPEKFDQNCHRNLPDNALQTLQHWNNQLDLDEKSQATRSDYLEKASIFLRNADKTPDEVQKQDVIDFLSDRSSSGRRTYKATLRQFFLWYYLDYKELPEDELPRFVDNQLKVSGSSGQDKVKKEDIPKEDEVKSLLETAWNHRDRALIAVLADRGMRISEALALDIKDVNFDQAGIYLMVPEAKKDYESYRKNRLTWSRPALKDWLETHPRRDEEDAPLFVKLQNRQDEDDYRSLKYDAARHAFEKLRERAGVRENITLHKFRHYSTTQDRQKKHMRDSFIVQDKGWDDPSMLERYDHLTDDTVDRAHIKQMVEDGQLEKSVLEKMNGDGKNGEITELELIRCPNCGDPNSPERDYCDTCNQPFNEEGIDRQERLQNLAQKLLEDRIEEEEILDELQDERSETAD